MKRLDKIQAQEQFLKRQMEREKADSQKRINRIAKNLEKTRGGYPFRCKKCGLAFRVSEIGYKLYETIRNRQECQPMGDYDIWQEVSSEKLGCCPKCGFNFKVPVAKSEIVHVTERYGRWDGRRPDFKPVGSKCLSAIRKLDKYCLQYLRRYLREQQQQ